jgi:hypothetical protein
MSLALSNCLPGRASIVYDVERESSLLYDYDHQLLIASQ